MNEQDQIRIENYLYGRMTAEQERSFEQEVEKDAALAEALELERLEQRALRLLDQDRLREQMAGWKAEKKQLPADEGARVVSITRRRFLYRVSAAASVLLLLGIPLWWANQNYSDQALLGGALDLESAAGIRSDAPAGEALQPARGAYQDGAVDEAIRMLRAEAGSPYADQAQLLLGKLYADQEDYAAAERVFSALSEASADVTIREDAQWLLANVYLSRGEEAPARDLLNTIAGNPDHYRRSEAAALLAKLNSFWRYLVF